MEVADKSDGTSGLQGWWLLQLAVLGILTALSGAAVGNGPGLHGSGDVLQLENSCQDRSPLSS